jgi:hypothetical protein
MNADLFAQYQKLTADYQSVTDKKRRQIKLISAARFASFVGIIPSWYYLSQLNGVLAMAVASTLFVSFLFLIKKFIQTEKDLLFFQALTEINQNECGAIQRDYSPFADGTEFIDPHHDFSYDLDMYGPGSLFQFINRTVTGRGKAKLSSFLNQSMRTVNDIASKQSVIAELSGELNWRQYFLAKGKETQDQKDDSRIDKTIHHKIQLKSEKLLKYLLLTLPILTIVLIGLNSFGIVAGSIYLLPVFCQWVIFLIYNKTITKFQKQFENQSKILSRYYEMLHHIETKTFNSTDLKHLTERLRHRNDPAGEIIKRLQKILHQFEYRQNILVGFVLNSVLLWDIRCIYKLYHWQQNYAGDLPQWFNAIAEIDALISLANCDYNHPEWVIPAISSSKSHFKAEEIGHPLIDERKCIRNSFQLAGEEQIAIITGANMAGKSTFLRTIGVNLILASNGCKVCASSFDFSPFRLYTNMRTSDNLMNDESYFYAELLRLQSMLNLIREGENLFVIVDEMLKGTNSTDKLNGSKALLHQLISLQTHGIIATHDLGLTELIQIYPSAIRNKCFEVQLQGDELSFDYLLTDGVTRTMNATFLMKKMGIIPKD